MKKKIMIVDDEQDLRQMVSLMMRKVGHEVIEAESGKACFEQLKKGQMPDLILLDILMPEMNGWQVFKELKDKQDWKKIPVAFLTIKTDSFSKELGKSLAQDYIEKPFEITDLKARIDKMLERTFEISETKERIVEDIRNKLIITNVQNGKEQGTKSMMKIMVVDDEQDLREMINVMVQKEGFETEIAENGSEFLDKVDKFKPDLVTLDVMMPGLTTWEIFEELKKKNVNPKIIMLTVVRYSEGEKERLFKMANVVDYIIKPFDVDYFIDTLKKHVKKQHSLSLHNVNKMNNELSETDLLKNVNEFSE